MNNNNNKNGKTMVEKRMNMEQGHWVLAKLGKKVLRPGGKALTQIMLKAMNITPNDDVVEFAPGLGYTAKLALSLAAMWLLNSMPKRRNAFKTM